MLSYYLNTSILPTDLTYKKAMCTDARQFIWTRYQDNMDIEEIGSKGAMKKYISKHAENRPVKQGGAGILNWPNHLISLAAQWIFKLVHPRQALWIHVLNHWVPNIKQKLFSNTTHKQIREILDAIPSSHCKKVH